MDNKIYAIYACSLFGLLTAILFGGLIGTGNGLSTIILVTIGLCFIALFVFSEKIQHEVSQALFIAYVALFVPLIHFLVAAIFGVALGYFLEFFIFIIVPLFLILRARYFEMPAGLLFVLICLLGSVFFAVISTLLGRSQQLAAAWQFIYNWKWFLMLLAGALCSAPNHLPKMVRIFTVLFLMVCLPVLIIEIAFPAQFMALFSSGESISANTLLFGIVKKCRSIFPHSGYLVVYSGVLFTWSLVSFLIKKNKFDLICGAVLFVMMLLAGQRQEFISIVLALSTAYLLRRFGFKLSVLSAIPILSGLLILVAVGWGPFAGVFDQWGLGYSMAVLSERAELTKGGIAIANDYFPLGAGLGTYGGPGAQKFDQTLFEDYGFMQFWWFRKGMFLVDTYWPNIFAEGGYFSALFLLLSFFIILIILAKKVEAVKLESCLIPCVAFVGFVLLLLNTTSSPLITDPRGSIFIWYLVGLALSLKVNLKGKHESSF